MSAFNAVNGLAAGVSATQLVDNNGNYINGNTSDMLSNRISSEVSLTGSSTATISVWNRVNSLSGNVTITLPSATSNSGKFIGIIIDPNCGSYLVTIQDNGGAYIDYDYFNSGASTRIMWAGETVMLYSNGTYWHKVQGKTIPMCVGITLTSNQLFSAGVITLIAMTASRFRQAPSSFITLATPVVTVKRPGYYAVDCHLGFNNTNTSATAITIFIYKDGSAVEGMAGSLSASTPGGLTLKYCNVFAAGSTIQPYGRFSSGSYTTTTMNTDGISNSFTVTELPRW